MRTCGFLRGLTAESFVLLAPADQVPATYSRVEMDDRAHGYWLRRAQALRGGTYLQDGALSRSDLTADGRLVSQWDRQSWHVIAHEDGVAVATMRLTFSDRPVDVATMQLAQSGLFRDATAGRAVAAIEAFQMECLGRGYQFAEVGGWAVSPEHRGNRKSAALVLSSWPVARAIGNVGVISTITERNHSFDILRRMGAMPVTDEFGELPAWEDAVYSCRMHLAKLATWHLSTAYRGAADELAALLSESPVFARTNATKINGVQDESEGHPESELRAA